MESKRQLTDEEKIKFYDRLSTNLTVAQERATEFKMCLRVIRDASHQFAEWDITTHAENDGERVEKLCDVMRNIHDQAKTIVVGGDDAHPLLNEMLNRRMDLMTIVLNKRLDVLVSLGRGEILGLEETFEIGNILIALGHLSEREPVVPDVEPLLSVLNALGYEHLVKKKVNGHSEIKSTRSVGPGATGMMREQKKRSG